MSVTRLSRIRQALATFVLGYMLYLRPLAAELLPLRHVANPAPLAPGPSCTDANNSAYNPHRSPHEPGSPDPWFEGWYVRVTAEDGASSFAVGIGHFPEQQGILPHSAAACFLLASGPGEQLRLYSARFDNISVLTPSTSTTSTTTTTTTTTTKSRETSDPPYPPVDFALVATDNGTAHTDQEHRDADAAGAGHAHALSQHNYCVWNLTQQRLQISARLQGASVRIRLDRGGGGRCTAASPWSPQAASTGPEGWLSQWGFLLKLEYDVLSLRTPVQYVIREPGGDVVRQGDGGGARDTGAGVHGEGQEGAAGEVPMLLPSDDRGDGYEMGVSAGQRMLTAMQAGAQAEGAAGSASAAEQGQRGQQQDEEAKGAEGADSTLPRQWSSGWAHLEKNWGASFPDEWVWAQGHKHGPSCQEASFVLAGGMLPHVLEPLVPAVRQFVLSYHPPGGRPPVTMDPWDPPVLSSLEVQGCQGVLVVELYSPFKIGRVVARAPASTFQAVPCPTNDGFRNFSVESFAAHVELSIWARPFPFAPASASRLLYEDEFESAALEFGGAYVCPEGMPQLNSLEM